MNRIRFYNWLNKSYAVLSPKNRSDICSRVSRIEHALKNCDLDEEYARDNCASIIYLFRKLGKNEEMQSRLISPTSLPVGKTSLSTYTHALRYFIEFKQNNCQN